MKKNAVVCEHCATPFVPRGANTRFCCKGCEHVYNLIREESLGRFYDLQAGSRTNPIRSLAFELRDYAWLAPLVENAEAECESGESPNLELSVSGITCAACVWLIQRVFEREQGALDAIADANRGRLTLRWERGQCDLEQFAKTLQGFGYEVAPAGQGGGGDATLLKRVGLCAAFAMNAMAFTLPRYLGMPADFMLAGLFELIAATSAALAMAVGGSYFISRAARALRAGSVHIDLPIALGIIAAFCGSLIGWIAGFAPLLYFDFVATFIFLMLGGRWIQERSLGRNRNQLADRSGAPERFRRAGGGEPEPIEDLAAGADYLLSPGEIVPVASTVNEEAPFGLGWISGEAEAPSVPAGGIAPSGAVYLGSGTAEFRAREEWANALLKRLTERSSGAAQNDPILARTITFYIVVIVMLGFGGGAAWLSATGDWSRALQVAISVFVVSCPCALGVALPLAERLAAGHAATAGAYPQRGGFWSRITRARKVLFDKTGTLTLGTPTLMNSAELDSLSAEATAALMRMAHSSVHPVSRSIAEELAERGVSSKTFDSCEPEEVPGHGMLMRDESARTWGLHRDDNALSDAVFSLDGETLATLHFRDVIREDAAEEVAALRDEGLDVFLMSGDREEKVAAMAEQLGLPTDHWRARMSPDDKAAWVRELDRRDSLYVGDGANDSLAFDAAFATATPATELGLLQDKADLYFLGRRMGWLSRVRGIAKLRKRAIRRVITFAITYNIIVATVALSGLMNPLLAAILMPISSAVTVGIVSLSLSKSKESAPENTGE